MKKTPTTPAKKDATYSTDDVKRYLGSLSEDFQGRVSAIGEQFAGLNRKIDDATSEIHRINRTLDAHTNMIGAIAEDVAIIKNDITTIKGDLKKKVDYDDFQALARRVALLEKHARR